MIISRYFGLFILAITLAVSGGCKKDKDESTPVPEENPDNSSPTAQSMNANVNGNSFSSENAVARYRTNEQLTIKASDNEENTFLFVINNFSGTVTYTVGIGSQNSAQYFYELGGENIHFTTTSSGSGNLTITEYNESEQLLSGTFSFTAGQVGSPENSIEVSNGEFQEVPISSLQMPDAGEAVFYFNDQFFVADSIEATLVPPFMLDVNLYHNETGWCRTQRRLHLYPDYEQYSTGLAVGNGWSYLPANFSSEFNSESETISQSMELEEHDYGVYDFEYKVNDLTVSTPYTTESQTVTVWVSANGADPTVTVCTDAFLSPNVNGTYELSATNENGDQLMVQNLSQNPLDLFGNHLANAIGQGFGGIAGGTGLCFWQESELGNDRHSFEFSLLSSNNEFTIVAKDILIDE